MSGVVKFVEVHLGDVVELRKPHACGGVQWVIVRLGADIGLRCENCEHRVMLARSHFEKRLKEFVSRAPEWVPPDTAIPPSPPAGDLVGG